MLNEETKRKLRLLNLASIIDIIEQQDSDVQTVALPFDQRFQRIVDFVFQEKYDDKVQRLIKSAHLRFANADMHDIYYSPKRRINRDVMNELATCMYIRENKNIILQGYTSSGKTYLGCALGKEACRQHYRTRYIRLPDLLDDVKEKAILECAERTSRTGEPIMRPMFFDFPDDANCLDLSDQYMFGPDILFAPIINQGQTERSVYLPKGEWIRTLDKKVYEGERWIIVAAAIDEYIAFVRKGADIIRLWEES